VQYRIFVGIFALLYRLLGLSLRAENVTGAASVARACTASISTSSA